MLRKIYFIAPSDQETLNKILNDLKSKGYTVRYVLDVLSLHATRIIRSNTYKPELLTDDFYSERLLDYCKEEGMVQLYSITDVSLVNIF